MSLAKLALIAALIVPCAGWLSTPAHAGLTQSITAQDRPLAFVGNIAFGVPQMRAGETIVPLTFSSGEWLQHSAIALHRIDTRVADRIIEMTVFTAVPGGKAVPLEIKPGKLAPGEYTVVYKDPDGTRHTLSRITVPDPKAAQPPLGKYVRISRHEYGADTRTYELLPNQVARFESEEEGRDSANLQGTWRWNAADKTVTLEFADKGNTKQVYVFRLQGEQLVMIAEPKRVPPPGVTYTGLIGTAYVKQPAGGKHLCAADERVVFACTFGNGAKTVSLCASRELTEERGRFYYVFGTAEKAELVYPDKTSAPQGRFKRTHLMFAGATGGYAYSFDHAGHTYALYSISGTRFEDKGLVVFKGNELRALSAQQCDAGFTNQYDEAFLALASRWKPHPRIAQHGLPSTK